MVPQRRGMSGLYTAPALASWVHMPALRVVRRALGDVAGAVALPSLPRADVADRWDDLQDTRKPLRMWFMAMWSLAALE